jgi:hypothetical protein
MELTYDNVIKWFNAYFQAFNDNEGNPQTAENMRQYFMPDLEFYSYNMADEQKPTGVDHLISAIEHPGFHEVFRPQYYVYDERQKILVAQLELQFTETATGTVYPAKMASAHYHIVQDEKGNLRIKKALYWVEASSPSEPGIIEKMRKYREEQKSGG